jgi:hypothetical protein
MVVSISLMRKLVFQKALPKPEVTHPKVNELKCQSLKPGKTWFPRPLTISSTHSFHRFFFFILMKYSRNNSPSCFLFFGFFSWRCLSWVAFIFYWLLIQPYSERSLRAWVCQLTKHMDVTELIFKLLPFLSPSPEVVSRQLQCYLCEVALVSQSLKPGCATH